MTRDTPTGNTLLKMQQVNSKYLVDQSEQIRIVFASSITNVTC